MADPFLTTFLWVKHCPESDRQRLRQRDGERERQTEGQTERRIDRERQTEGPTERQTGMYTVRDPVFIGSQAFI